MSRLVDGGRDLLGGHADLQVRSRCAADTLIGIVVDDDPLVHVEDGKSFRNGLQRCVENFAGFPALPVKLKIIRNIPDNAHEPGFLTGVIGHCDDTQPRCKDCLISAAETVDTLGNALDGQCFQTLALRPLEIPLAGIQSPHRTADNFRGGISELFQGSSIHRQNCASDIGKDDRVGEIVIQCLNEVCLRCRHSLFHHAYTV